MSITRRTLVRAAGAAAVAGAATPLFAQARTK
jgi:hypothetical protein